MIDRPTAWCPICGSHLTYGKRPCPVCTDKQLKQAETERRAYFQELAS